jgi:rRNA processing protein Krr1/Pno1
MASSQSALDPIITITIPCPHTKKGAIIGPRGTTIQAIQAQSSTRIAVSNITPTITVTGTASSIALAQTLLDTRLHPPTITFTCEYKHVGKIIGPGGATLRSLQRLPGIRVVIDNPRLAPKPKYHLPCTVTITGPTLALCQQVESAVQQLLHPPAIHVQCHRVELLGALIGARGSTILRLQQETGARIVVEPKPTDRTTSTVTITITGPTLECRKAALSKVLAIIQPPPGERVLTFLTEKVHHRLGRLFGPAGSTLKRLQSMTHTRIQVDSGDSRDFGRDHSRDYAGNIVSNNASHTVKVHVSSTEGGHSEVDRAIRLIEGWLLPMTVELTAPKAMASAIIGDNGDNIKRIQEHCQNCVMEREEEQEQHEQQEQHGQQEQRYASKYNDHPLDVSGRDREASSECSDQTGCSFETKVTQTSRFHQKRRKKKKRKWAEHDPFQAYIEVTLLGVRTTFGHGAVNVLCCSVAVFLLLLTWY